MNRNNLPGIRLREDVALFREALSFTAARTAFPAALIEKDYFCTVLLAYLDSCPPEKSHPQPPGG
jgi:hypothetical protein